jgi:hypothetical protein
VETTRIVALFGILNDAVPAELVAWIIVVGATRAVAPGAIAGVAATHAFPASVAGGTTAQSHVNRTTRHQQTH